MTGNYSISLRSCTVTIAAEPHKCCSFFIAKIKKKNNNKLCGSGFSTKLQYDLILKAQ
jgi:hypothetical protein